MTPHASEPATRTDRRRGPDSTAETDAARPTHARTRDGHDAAGTRERKRDNDPVRAVQRAHGNAVLQRFVQRRVDADRAESGDASPAEREASRIGDAVCDLVSRPIEALEEHPKARLDRQTDQPRLIRQRATTASPEYPFTSDRQRLDAGRPGAGRRLSGETRAFFETLYGTSLSSVTVHTGPVAADRAAALGARAYAYGDDVVFGRNQFDPGSADGLGLLAHELVHVVQQRHGVPHVARQPNGALETAQTARSRRLREVIEEIDQIGNSVAGARLSGELRAEVADVVVEGVRRRNLDLASEPTMEVLTRQITSNFHSDDAHAILESLAELRAEMMTRGTDAALESLRTPSGSTGLGPVYGPGAIGPFPMSGIAGKAIDQTKAGGAFFDATRYTAGQTMAFTEGLAQGWASGLKGLLHMIVHPIETIQGMAHLVIHYDETADAIGGLISDYIEAAHTDPQEFARMTGALVGEIHVALVTPNKVLKGRDVAGAVGTASVTTGRLFGFDTPLWHYTNRVGREGIESTRRGENVTLRAGSDSGGVFATTLHPALGGSSSFAGAFARAALGLSRWDFSRVGRFRFAANRKPPFTDAVRFMSPEFRLLFKTPLESQFARAAKSFGLQFGASGDQMVRILAMEALSDPIVMERLLNSMGYAVTSSGIVVHESDVLADENEGDTAE